MYIWRKFETSIPSGYLETEVSATGEYFAHMHKNTHTCTHKGFCISTTCLCKFGLKMTPHTGQIPFSKITDHKHIFQSDSVTLRCLGRKDRAKFSSKNISY